MVQVPSCFYGRYSEVKSRCKKAVTALKRGKTWEEAVDTSSMVDTIATPGLIVLDGPSSLVGGTLNFHCYPLLSQVQAAITEKRLLPEVEETIFRASLQTVWGVLGLIAQTNVMWFAILHLTPEYHIQPLKERYQPFLDAVLKFWDELYAEGERYTNGSNTGTDLWSNSSNLKYVLANMGVPTELLQAPLPMGGIETLLSYIKS
ncbi:hypothetical protein [Anthocerotibacter panamensis]|uniref:hypothetical protein n=1 Tax=Anthocerotibacter panamensis TaxID=2857077 RepID=UPI001C403FC1|nr:hypothetical protein [Anthocerotibacter panamensis]